MPDFPARYIADLTSRPKLRRRLKVVAACGNGTAGAFAPKLLSALGVEVVPLDCELDFTFPRYNPNPEDMRMLHAMAVAVEESGADLALGFDGDGDRCGVVDNESQEILADKIGVMLRGICRRSTRTRPSWSTSSRPGCSRPIPRFAPTTSRSISGRPAIRTSSGGSET